MKTEDTITRTDYSNIHASPTNPRTHYDEKGLDEMRDSVIEKGILMPLIVRPSKTQKGGFEIVAGERRFRGTGRALEKLAASDREELYKERFQVPIILREIDDAELLELQMLENLQREDLTPVEEARGFQRMIDENDRTPAEISQVLGVHKQTVLYKLALLQAPKILLEALEQGRIFERQVVLVAKVPGADRREKCAKEVLDGEWDYRVQEHVPLTVSSTRILIDEKYRKSLKDSSWALDDAELLPEAGACSNCPHFAKHAAQSDPDLAAELGNTRGKTDPLTCMQPECFKKKVEATYKRKQKEAKETGEITVLSKTKGKETIDQDSGYLLDKNYVNLDEKVGWEFLEHYDSDKAPTWRQVVEDRLPKGALTVAKAGDGLVELVSRTEAIKAGRGSEKHGDLFKKSGAKKPKLTAAEKAKRAKELFAKKVETQAKFEFLRLLSVKAADRPADKESGLLLLNLALKEAGMDGCRLIGKWLELEPKVRPNQQIDQGVWREGIMKFVKDRESTRREIELFTLIALFSRWLAAYGLDAYNTSVGEIAKFYGFSLETAKKQAEAELRAQSAKPAAGKKTPMKSKGKKTPMKSKGKPAPNTENETAAEEIGKKAVLDEAAEHRKKHPSKKAPAKKAPAKKAAKKLPVPRKAPARKAAAKKVAKKAPAKKGA